VTGEETARLQRIVDRSRLEAIADEVVQGATAAELTGPPPGVPREIWAQSINHAHNTASYLRDLAQRLPLATDGGQ